ncbi:MAG: tautomerase family protein [Tistrella sp.]|jgi:phenylpyruvate tautomerase PptA (4-oxalocrotonate tautomerase family)|uniref:4-oxalocrotonate tautomerase n=1 Tax=Tistrella mobilis TaxID=171437 RepID=A0A162KHT4_9PROT|nr:MULTISPECIES: tautomerase family protein [Tistrella]KYO51305.1 4-oxalocrotonate tautomerase [Tistrella mobilis]MAD36330.1 tautomerase family protein [Tistrella sp.]MBA77765.1 tautomerase family protein [Tistrella sp.]HAE48308.1 tautomerase family protein [Tistrella mobilis]
MPLVHISLRSGKPEAWRQAIFDGVYQALRDTFDVPEDDQFMAIHEHEPANFRYGARCFGIERSDDLVYIQLTVNNTRTTDQKKALYRRMAGLLAENPGLRPQDVFINLVEVQKENWSTGNGLATFI